jgi:hypothetical protein
MFSTKYFMNLPSSYVASLPSTSFQAHFSALQTTDTELVKRLTSLTYALCFFWPLLRLILSLIISHTLASQIHIFPTSHNPLRPRLRPALFNAQEKNAPDWVKISIPHPVALRWMTSWLWVWRNHWMTVRISDTCLIRCVYTWYQDDCLIGRMVHALTVDTWYPIELLTV